MVSASSIADKGLEFSWHSVGCVVVVAIANPMFESKCFIPIKATPTRKYHERRDSLERTLGGILVGNFQGQGEAS